MKKSTYIKTGIIVLVALSMLVWGINYLKGHDYFKNQDSYFAIYEKIDGLQVASPVLINGFKVGQVREINFMPDRSNRLLVRIMIDNKIQLPQKTIAKIFSSDLMGSKSIELITNKNQKNHQPWDTLLAAIEGTLQEQVSLQMLPLKTQAEKLMLDMEQAIATINYIFNEKTRENLSKSFSSIKTTVEKIEHSSFTFDTIVTSQKSRFERIFANVESITSNIRLNNDKITAILTNFAAISDTIKKSEIKNTLVAANQAIEQVYRVFDQINNGQGSLGMLVHNDSLYRNLEKASFNLNQLVSDLKENPKRYVRFSIFNFGKEKQKKQQEKSEKSFSILLKKSDNQLDKAFFESFIPNLDVQEYKFQNKFYYCTYNENNPYDLLSRLPDLQAHCSDASIVQIVNE